MKNIKSFCAALAAFLLLATNASAQAWTDTLKVQADSASFDFWIGDWKLEWKNPDGSTSRGENKIFKTLNGKVIQENFKALDGPSKGFDGMSVSVFNPKNAVWEQTWVDNSGGYLAFTSYIGADGRKYFARSFYGPKGRRVWQRMVFYDITPNSFGWDWETSADDGIKWQLAWRILYKK